MAKKIKKIFSAVLLMCFLFSSLPAYALAAESNEPESKLDLSGSVVANIDSTTTTTYDENGNPTVVVEFKETTTNGTSDDGAAVSGLEQITSTTTYHPDGSVQIETVIDGNEKKEWTDLEIQPGQEVPDIELKLKDGETTAVVSNADNPYVDVDMDASGTSTTTTTTQRQASASVSGLEIGMEMGGQKTELNSPVAPQDYEGKQYVDWDKAKEHDHYNAKTNPDGYSEGYDPHSFEGIFANGKDAYINQFNGDYAYVAPKPDDSGENAGIDQGYDFVWTGSGDATYGSIPVFAEEIVWLEVVYKTDENGETVLDENGDPVIDPIKSVVDMEKTTFALAGNKMTNDPLTGREATGMVSSPAQFALMNEYGQFFYAYCMDAGTGTSPDLNSWYQLRNLEDAIISDGNDYGYISEDEAAMIRAIALNGYWGSDPNIYETDENGNIKYEPVLDEHGNPVMEKQYVYEYDEDGKLIYEETEDGKLIIKRSEIEVPATKPVAKRDDNGQILTDSSVMGSIASIKQLMKDNYNSDSTVTVRYPGSNTGHEVSIFELIDGLTEAEALAVTQAAIWTYANANDPLSGTVVGVLSASKYHNTNSASFLNQYRPLYLTDKDALESDARMQALYELFLTKLEPIYENDALNKASRIVPNGEAISDVALVIKDKVEDHTDNLDDNKDNDVYNSDLSFTLAFVPDANSDDLMVYLYNGNELMKDSDGKPIVRRLAGSNAENENYEGVEYDAASGSYLLTGLQLSENTDYTFNLKLEGVQHLDKGVYIYQAHGGERSSGQTLVGLVEGEQYFEASATMSLSFEVDESCNVVVQRAWHDELDPVNYPPNPPTPIDDDPPPSPPDDEEEEPEDDYSLSDPVGTGDDSVMWPVIILMAMFALAAINLPARKREN